MERADMTAKVLQIIQRPRDCRIIIFRAYWKINQERCGLARMLAAPADTTAKVLRIIPKPMDCRAIPYTDLLRINMVTSGLVLMQAPANLTAILLQTTV